ncbi:MAG TPA: isoprenylcysteine carboxylmethyltransferase family protein [Sedimentisphaerales bacterium]|nr:isoprenylcysteine carboxylmethyltransferase family protein [Sedimentisphaerales bacterium]
MEQNETGTQKKPSYKKVMVRSFVFIVAGTVCMFLLAGRLSYWQGWVLGGTYFVIFVVVLILFAHKGDLLAERVKPGPGVKGWDRIFFSLYAPCSLGVYVVACLDGGRFGWTGPLPVGLYVASYIVLVLSVWGIFWAMWTNKFFSRVVRIQTERGHYVVQDGPYRYVRHPGYLAGSFTLPAMALVAGSLWALIPAGAAVVLLIGRTYLEDRTLRKELAGYAEYAEKVRFRLLPGLW